MAFSTLAAIRSKLNLDLGLTSDGEDAPWGDTDTRNAALQDAFSRLWPVMARLVRESITVVPDATDYTLTAIEDLQTVEVVDSGGRVVQELRNWRVWRDESADPSVLRLTLPAAFNSTTYTLRAIGYAPYTVPASSSASCDLPARLEWIVVYGARAFLYRRRFNEWVDFERKLNDNRGNSVSAAEIFQMYRDADTAYERGKAENARRLALPKSANLRR